LKTSFLRFHTLLAITHYLSKERSLDNYCQDIYSDQNQCPRSSINMSKNFTRQNQSNITHRSIAKFFLLKQQNKKMARLLL